MANHKVVPEARTCPVCQDTFFVGGRGRPGKKAVFCGKVCSAAARVRTPGVRAMTPTEAAYLAGIIDGEGSIVAAKQRENRITYRLNVWSTTPELLHWCKKATGVGTIHEREVISSKHSRSFFWQCYSSNAYEILVQIRPYLQIYGKQERADAVIKQFEELKALNRHELTSEDSEEAARFRDFRDASAEGVRRSVGNRGGVRSDRKEDLFDVILGDGWKNETS